MIVSASYRTDIPAFYGDWFMNQRAVGHAMVANPYGGKPYKVPLKGRDVDGFVFWTRNAGPFLPALAELHAEGVPFVVQFTFTGYPRALEHSVPAGHMALGQMQEIARLYGPRVLVWRYDPVLVSEATPPDWHVNNFANLSRQLAGTSDEVCLSFAHIYRKTARNLDGTGISWRDPDVREKADLLDALGGIAGDIGMTATVCSQPAFKLKAARCIDAIRLSDVAGREINVKQKGNRDGCVCAESRDIGAYDTCPHGCSYCYAVARPADARSNLRRHDPNARMLLPTAKSALP